MQEVNPSKGIHALQILIYTAFNPDPIVRLGNEDFGMIRPIASSEEGLFLRSWLRWDIRKGVYTLH
jgi:hypothetical protein